MSVDRVCLAALPSSKHPGPGRQLRRNIQDRFAIGDRDALKFNPDGSLDLYIQNESPDPAKESNWLPAPKSGQLGLTLRLYAPKPEVAEGRWNPPPVRPSTSIGRALQ